MSKLQTGTVCIREEVVKRLRRTEKVQKATEKMSSSNDESRVCGVTHARDLY